jgi:hypothetical protein
MMGQEQDFSKFSSTALLKTSSSVIYQTFGFRFSEFRIRDCVPVYYLYFESANTLYFIYHMFQSILTIFR